MCTLRIQFYAVYKFIQLFKDTPLHSNIIQDKHLVLQGNKYAHQSRRLPYWIWFVLAKSLGINLSPDDKPILGTFMHVLTLTLALGFAITFTWHKVYDIASEYTKETVLKGNDSINCLNIYLVHLLN